MEFLVDCEKKCLNDITQFVLIERCDSDIKLRFN